MQVNKDFNKAMELLKAGKLKLALKRFDKAVDASPDEFEPIFQRGVCYFRNRDAEEAQNDFIMADELDPGNKEVLRFKGETNLVLGNYDEAIEDLEIAKEDPDIVEEAKDLLAQAYLERSYEYFSRMDVKSAEKDAVSAFEYNPEDESIWLQLGNIYSQMEEFQKAMQYYSEGSKLAPEEGVFHHNMGSVHLDLGNNAVAERYFKKAEELGYQFTEEERAY